MNWQDSSEFMEEEGSKLLNFQKLSKSASLIKEEREEKTKIQLDKFKDPEKDVIRQSCIALMNKFGECLSYGNYGEIVNNLMAPTCEAFLFFSARDVPVRYSLSAEGFPELYKGVKVMERWVRETNVDVIKNVGFQISYYRLFFEAEDAFMDEACFEIFNIVDNKITKYRAASSCLTENHGFEDPFVPTTKEIILAKMKRANYALADQPDLEKYASLLHENAEYKVWNWEGQKCFIFTRETLPKGYKNMEKNIKLKCVVPYEIIVKLVENNKWISLGTYAYNLEDDTKDPPEKYVWFSNVCYTMTEDAKNFLKATQLGELHPENETSIPFEVYSREYIEQRVYDFFVHIGNNYDLWYNDMVDFSCYMLRIGPLDLPFMGVFKGLGHMEKVASTIQPSHFFQKDWAKAVDVFVDHHDRSYDCGLVVGCLEGAIKMEGYKYDGMKKNTIMMAKQCFENGKLTKMIGFMSEIPEAIPSPFDDLEFSAMNIIKKEKEKKTESTMSLEQL